MSPNIQTKFKKLKEQAKNVFGVSIFEMMLTAASGLNGKYQLDCCEYKSNWILELMKHWIHEHENGMV